MSPEASVLIALALFVGLVLAKVPIAFGLLSAGTLGLLLQEGFDRASAVLANQPFQSVFNYSLIVVPLFIALGVYVREAGVAEALYRGLSRSIGRLPGGLAVATVFAGAGFAAVSGSSTATAATLGKLSIREMLSSGYSKESAGGVVASAGTLGILIPPSIALVLFGTITGESIGGLLLAGIVPGILTAFALASTAVIVELLARKRVRRRSAAHQVRSSIAVTQPIADATRTGASAEGSLGSDAAAVAALESRDEQSPEMRVSTGVALAVITVLFMVVVGGIYTGQFTPTESAAIGALMALLFLVVLVLIRDPRSIGRRLAASVRETVSMSSMIFAIFIGAGLFNYLLVSGRVPARLTEFVAGLDVAPVLIVIAFLLILVPLGMFLDGTAMMLIVAPLTYPVVTALGYEGLWFAILFVKLVEIGLLTPPVGLNAYVVAGVAEELKVEQVFRGILPYLVAEGVVVATLFAFPALVTWLPNLSQ